MLEEIFNAKKPIIGMVHLKPLPDSSDYKSFDEVIDFAIKDANALVEGGVDGLLIENFGDTPYFKEVPKYVLPFFTRVAYEIKKEFDLPLGINVLRNDAIAALAIATAINAEFIRVNVYTGIALTDQGIIEGKAHETLRLKRILKSDVRIFADVHVKHAYHFFDIAQEAKHAYFRGKADALIVTGRETGEAPSVEDVKKVKQATNAPVLVGSGVNVNNIKNFLEVADGFIIGTYFKKNGKVENAVDVERVRKLTKSVRTYPM